MTKAIFILYVKNQEVSSKFYSKVLGRKPDLQVPGMTEFILSEGSSLGLMPCAGIKSLLGDALPDPKTANGIPRAELYLLLDKPEEYHSRVLENGGKELSPMAKRPWGDRVAYSLDPDGHVLAFAQPSPTEH